MPLIIILSLSLSFTLLFDSRRVIPVHNRLSVLLVPFARTDADDPRVMMSMSVCLSIEEGERGRVRENEGRLRGERKENVPRLTRDELWIISNDSDRFSIHSSKSNNKVLGMIGHDFEKVSLVNDLTFIAKGRERGKEEDGHVSVTVSNRGKNRTSHNT